MIVLDTNVISALMQKDPPASVVGWLNDQPAESVWTTSICLFEICYGLEILPKGRKRKALEAGLERAMTRELEGRVLELDAVAARRAASCAARLRATGRTVEIRDVLIAGIVAARRGTLATRNTSRFLDSGIPLVNPWEE